MAQSEEYKKGFWRGFLLGAITFAVMLVFGFIILLLVAINQTSFSPYYGG